jgi:hypothetical protein
MTTTELATLLIGVSVVQFAIGAFVGYINGFGRGYFRGREHTGDR